MPEKTPSLQSRPLAEPSPAVDYFINITVSKKKLHDQFPNIRIRIPKLLVKTVKNSRRRIQGSDDSGSGGGNNENTSKSKKRWGTPKKLFPILLKVFGGKKSMTSPSSSGKNRFFERGESSNDSVSSGTVAIINSTNSQNSEKNPLFSAFSLATRSPLCDLRGKTCMACRLSLEKEKKEEEWLGVEEKKEKLGEKGSCTSNSSDTINFDLSEIEEISLTETEEEEEDDNNDNNGQELCKKRILMGERCKPLNFSGYLRYDENGNSRPGFPTKS